MFKLSSSNIINLNFTLATISAECLIRAINACKALEKFSFYSYPKYRVSIDFLLIIVALDSS